MRAREGPAAGAAVEHCEAGALVPPPLAHDVGLELIVIKVPKCHQVHPRGVPSLPARSSRGRTSKPLIEPTKGFEGRPREQTAGSAWSVGLFVGARLHRCDSRLTIRVLQRSEDSQALTAASWRVARLEREFAARRGAQASERLTS